jgi:hypothetical protein
MAAQEESGKVDEKDQERPQAVEVVKGEEKTFISWTGPVRPFKKRGREFFSTVLALAVLLAIIFFFIEGVMPVFVIGAVVFLIYILSTVPPENTEYKLTNRGIKIAEKSYAWEVMSRFFLTERWGQKLLVVEMPGTFPGRLELVLTDDVYEEELKKIMLKYLPLEKTPPGFLDKAVGWLSQRIPLEG